MMNHPNAQEQHWAGDEGDAYIDRQTLSVNSRAIWLQRALRQTSGIGTVIEFGAGTGQNLMALRMLDPRRCLTGVEINQKAREQMDGRADAIYNKSILNWASDQEWDLAMTRGVLIHLPPEALPLAYASLYYSSLRYILIAEYYSPKPEEIRYRGRDGLLWKRDFAGEMMDIYRDLSLLDYGFVYHRDPRAPQDDVTWFLMEKHG